MPSYTSHLNNAYKKDTFQRKIDYFNYNFKEVLNNLNSKSTILEIGPGMGEFVKLLNERKIKSVDIVDNDKTIILQIKNNFKIRNSVVTNNITQSYKNLEKYDLIILIQVLEHIPNEAQSKLLSILYRNLKSKGHILIVVPNANNPLGIVERYGDLQHTGAFTSRSLEDLVLKSQIDIKNIKISGFEIPPSNLINLFRIVSQKLLHLALLIILMINGGVFFRVLTPNIILKIKKN